MKYLKVILLVLLFYSGDIKEKKTLKKKNTKKSLKMTSQLVIFRAIFFSSPRP